MAVQPPDGLNYNGLVGTLSSNDFTVEQKKNLAASSMASLDMNAKKDVTASALASLDDVSKREIVTKAGLLPSPNQKTTNTIWLLIVMGFVLVLVVVSTFLVIGVTFLGKKADDVQVMITVFTGVV